MKKIFVGLLLILVACGSRYVSLSRKCLPKTVSIEVPTVVEQFTLSFNGEELQLTKSTVTVVVQGAGVFMSSKGHILTCAHLFNVGISTSISVEMSNNTHIPAIVVYQDKDKDLALIKVEATNTNYAKIAYGSLEVGQEVMAIGNPLGLGFTVTHGIISYINRDLSEPYAFTQTDSPINPGNSGGPLFNSEGYLIGINARKIPKMDGLGFAITPNTIYQFLSVFKGLDND